MRVLVVEDDIPMGSMLKRGLAEEGHAVDLVGDGPEAVWRALEVSYDVIVLDLMLPGIDGFEVCRRLRAANRWTPILMLTARTDIEDRIASLDGGADDYMPKPFSFGELSARLRALARRGEAPRPTVIRAGDLSLDPATRRAWRGEHLIELTTKEFALLELFLRRAGDVLSRDVIRERVWDFAYQGGSNIVDQYVAYLRRKIDRPFGVDQLQTIRGAGYRLAAEPTTSPCPDAASPENQSP